MARHPFAKPPWGGEAAEVYVVTAASPSRSSSVRLRQRTYLSLMGLRTACFLAAVVLPLPLAARAAAIAAAVVLPYLAVVAANSFPRRS